MKAVRYRTFGGPEVLESVDLPDPVPGEGEALVDTVHGAAGGVGGLAVQIAKALGAGAVIGTASSDERRAFARDLGADHAIAYDGPDWPRKVLEHTAGRGADVILETIGGEVFGQNFECLATLGRCVVVGSTRGPGAPLEPRRLMARAQSLSGLYLPTFHARPDLVQRALRFLADAVAGGAIKASVSAVLPLSRAAEAHALLERRAVRGVLVLDPTG